jgi:hypothetical protein
MLAVDVLITEIDVLSRSEFTARIIYSLTALKKCPELTSTLEKVARNDESHSPLETIDMKLAMS